MRRDNRLKNSEKECENTEKKYVERERERERERIQGLRNGGSITIVMATIASTSLYSGRLFLSRASLRVPPCTRSSDPRIPKSSENPPVQRRSRYQNLNDSSSHSGISSRAEASRESRELFHGNFTSPWNENSSEIRCHVARIDQYLFSKLSNLFGNLVIFILVNLTKT